MFPRPFWLSRIETAWRKRPVVWLSGVRRVGKTTLASMVERSEYINCDLPSEVRGMADPELFLDKFPKGARIVLDEIHRLEDPGRLLKIAADVYPHLRVLATGSSTLAATRKFRDSLTGRKVSIHLPPVPWTECLLDAGITDLRHRLLHGGLPQQLLAKQRDPEFYSEWLDSFYARDVQELFNVRNRSGFIKCLQLLLRQSGGALNIENIAAEAEISRPTAISYLDALSLSHSVIAVKPYHGGNKREITHQPRCYGFDTGFVCHEKGWNTLRNDDIGVLWEHLVLDVLQTAFGDEKISYWRDKAGNEVDFIVAGNRESVTAVECKSNPDKFRPKNLAVFRSIYPQGDNLVLAPGIKTAYQKRFDALTVDFVPLTGILENAPRGMVKG
jgi:predicted AAA+ superfamily ATPase